MHELNKRREREGEMQKYNVSDVSGTEQRVYGIRNASYQTHSEPMTTENYREHVGDPLYNALQSLKPMYRDALLLQDAGYSLKEIAEIEYQKGTLASKNIDTVKSRLHLARQHIKSKVTRYGQSKTD
jgi:DNA-directed RNA polymerase specialized sigma24 family protein